MFCIYKTDPDWIRIVRKLPAETQVNFWRKGTNALKLELGSWFYFNQRRTKFIVGRGVLVDYCVLTIEKAWQRFGNGNGVVSLDELKLRARDILGVASDEAEIGCIVLSDLEFLPPADYYIVSEEEYSRNIVGPKYLMDSEIPALTSIFSSSLVRSADTLNEPGRNELTEGDHSYSYRIGYERNQEARRECLRFYGYDCRACGINMETEYGDAGKEFIHVHHISMIADSVGVRVVDPIKDLVPLCPNCHSIAHRRVPPFTVDELIKMRRGGVIS